MKTRRSVVRSPVYLPNRTAHHNCVSAPCVCCPARVLIRGLSEATLLVSKPVTSSAERMHESLLSHAAQSHYSTP